MLKPEYYLTKEGKESFENELQHLISIRRKEVADHLEAAADYGDLRENSEYDSALEEQKFLERRIEELDRVLRFSTIIEPHTGDEVAIGTRVGIRANDVIQEFVIVDSHESDPTKNMISHHSPIGASLIGKRVGDRLVVSTPSGKVEIIILTIGTDAQ